MQSFAPSSSKANLLQHNFLTSTKNAFARSASMYLCFQSFEDCLTSFFKSIYEIPVVAKCDRFGYSPLNLNVFSKQLAYSFNDLRHQEVFVTHQRVNQEERATVTKKSCSKFGRTLIAASPYGTLFPCYVGLTTGSFASYCYRVGSYWMFEFNFRSNFGLKKIS